VTSGKSMISVLFMAGSHCFIALRVILLVYSEDSLFGYSRRHFALLDL